MGGTTGTVGSTLVTLANGGEAHVWVGPRGVASVDLGYMKTGIRVVAAHPRVVILTHSDQDHINGALTFFAAAAAVGQSCGHVHQLWIPYEWAVLVDAFGQILAGGVAADDVRRTEQLAEPVVTPGELNVPDPTSPVQWEAALFAGEDDVVDSEVAEEEPEADESVAQIRLALQHAINAGFIETHQPPSDRDLADVAKDITKKAVKLRRILRDVDTAGWRIRWFSTDHTQAHSWRHSGEPGFVTIINAQEVRVHHAPPNAALLLHAAQLTVQNRRALAAYLWGPRAAGNAVIWSDGDGGGPGNLQRFPWGTVGVMSAPHHGSNNEAHEPIWASLLRSGWTPDIVRTGGFSKQTLYPYLTTLTSRRSRSTRDAPGFRPGDAVWRERRGFVR